MKRTLPLAAMERLLKRVGAHRVSEDAKAALRDVLEEYAEKIGSKANDLAKHAKRRTVTAEDIRLAGR
jgi:histone H3/H4